MSDNRRVLKQVEELMARVRSMKRGGDLDALLLRELAELNELVYREALAERDEAASKEADFPPSGVPRLRGGRGSEKGESRAKDQDGEGRDKV